MGKHKRKRLSQEELDRAQVIRSADPDNPEPLPPLIKRAPGNLEGLLLQARLPKPTKLEARKGRR